MAEEQRAQFKISDDVEFYGCAGKITSIELLPNDLKSYRVSYFDDGTYRTVNLYDFEFRFVEPQRLGFGTKSDA